MKSITISDKGQIAIPAQIRRKMNLQKGDELVIVMHENRILLEKPEALFKQFKDSFADITTHTEKSLKNLWNNKKDDIWSKQL